jgi:hypothetical protein
MKRIASILGDIVKVSLLLAIVGIGIIAEVKAQPVQPQDLYQIEQTFDHDFKVRNVIVNPGWDVRLIQSPEGTPTRLVVTTPCAEFFEEGMEPTLMEAQKRKRSEYGWYELKANQWMPRTTVVELFTSQPLERIELKPGARLTIQRFDFDSIHLDIDVDSGAVLIVDTLSNPGSTIIDVDQGTVDLRHVRGRVLNIWNYGNSRITEGDIQTTIPHRNEPAKEFKLHYISLNFGFDLNHPLLNDSRYGSPYNTNFGLTGHIRMTSNDMAINRLLAWNFGLDVSFSTLQLDNAVKVDGSRLVLDPSYGATPPRQSLYWCSVGLPVTLKFGFGKWGNPYLGAPFRGLYATLTPTLNFKPRLVTKSLDEDSHWSTDRERVDILSRFNIRAAIGLNCNIGGLDKVEFYIDLLPSFRSSAEAPQTRMFGLGIVF